jgi:hypothetical protein
MYIYIYIDQSRLPLAFWRCDGTRRDPMLSFRIRDALGPDQLLYGVCTGKPAEAVIVLPDRPKKELIQLSIRKFMVRRRVLG